VSKPDPDSLEIPAHPLLTPEDGEQLRRIIQELEEEQRERRLCRKQVRIPSQS
jgi:hypothetical protein